MADIEIRAIKFKVKPSVQIIDDAGDNKFLDLSSTSKAEFLITGNTNDFTMKSFRRTKIVTPREYWENHLPL